jgi:tryptophan-rich sensory protein
MNRELSSRWTFFHKVVFPTIWIGGFASGTAVMFLSPDAWNTNPHLREVRWMFLFALIVGAAFIYWSGIRMKKVWLAQNSLVISNYLEEITVPLQQVERVSGSFLMTPELVWLHFRQPTIFGKRIIFMPKLRLLGGFSQHPVVEELRQLIKEANRGI